MRKLFIGMFFVVCTFITAQTTTEEEYNYVTNGYAIQVKNGLDMKRGYYFKNLGNNNYSTNIQRLLRTDTENRKVTLNALFRTGDEKPCAIMVIYQLNRQEPLYICIPTVDADDNLWNKTIKALDIFGENAKTAIIFSLMYNLMNWGNFQ